MAAAIGVQDPLIHQSASLKKQNSSDIAELLYPNNLKNWFWASSKPQGSTIVSESILEI